MKLREVKNKKQQEKKKKKSQHLSENIKVY